jgi:TonB-linked SusC/RagA family outer membrane protein
MKLLCAILLLWLLSYAPLASAQQVTISKQRISIEQALKKIEKQSGYTFFYSSNLFNGRPMLELKLHNLEIHAALAEILKGTGLSYSVVAKTVIIKNIDKEAALSVPMIEIAGTVVDDNGQPIPGVSVAAESEGVRKIWVTQPDGTFRTGIIPSTGFLLFSCVGYTDKKITISGMKNIYVVLQSDNNQLDEVQINAYSSTSRRLNTGNTFTLKAEDFASSPAPSIFQIIQNRVPGLEIIQNTGQIGSSFQVRIRGVNGLNQVDPLYVIDGVSYPAGGKNLNPNGRSGGLPTLENNRNRGSLAQLGGNALNYINPEDIASIDVLKDADATSIYGSRGAYGVILITTKKGSPENNRIGSLNLVLDRSVSVVGILPKLMGTADYLTIRREALTNDGLAIGSPDLDLNGTYPLDVDNNWVKEMISGATQSSRLHARYSGTGERVSYAFVGSYNQQENIVRHNGDNKEGGFKFDVSTQSSNKKVEINMSALLNFTQNTMVPYDFTGDPATFRAPNAPSYFNTDGSLNWVNGANPYGFLNTDFHQDIANVIGASTVIYKPIKGLSLKTQIGYNLLNGSELRQIPTTAFALGDPLGADKANSTKNRFSIRTWSVEPFANYQIKVGEAQFSITSGATLQDKLVDLNVITGTGFPTDSRLNNPVVGSLVANRYAHVQNRYLGFFGSLNVNWYDKYIISSSIRYDGSTKFAPASRFGWFGSVAGAYVFTQEKAIKEKFPFLSFGKLRASYGTSGGDAIDNFSYLATYATGPDYLGDPTITTGDVANNLLHWEKNRKLDISISLGFFQDRLIFDAGFYHNTVSDLLYGSPISSVTGFSLVEMNSTAVIRNTGAEFSLSWENRKSRAMRWRTSAVFTLPKTEVISLSDYFLKPGYTYAIGYSPLNTKAYNYQGVDPQIGKYSYLTASGKRVYSLLDLTEADKTVNIDLVPTYFGSLTNSLRYKSLSFEFTMAFGGKMAKTFLGQTTTLPGAFGYNSSTDVLRRWQKPGDITDIPKPTSTFFGLLDAFAFSQSTGAYQRIYYLRMQNMSFSYNFGQKLIKPLHAKNMKVSLQGQNLFTFTNYKNLDPENAVLTQLPPLRMFNVELGVTF